MEDNEQLTLLNNLANEAKKRIVFYYQNLPEAQNFKKEEVLKRTIEILDNLELFEKNDPDKSYAANCLGNKITVNSSFFYDRPREEQIAVLIHEMNHAISDSNKNNYDVLSYYGDAQYEYSYQMIEEGLADTNAELIMNYYYDHSGEEIEEKCTNFDGFTCGYSFNRSVIKTLLAVLQVADIDKTMLLEYYYGDKKLFFDKIIEIFGERFFSFLKSKDCEDYDKAFRFFEEIFYNELDKKDVGSKGFYAPCFDNVYFKENNLANGLRISYFIQVLLRRYDVDNVDLKMINDIYRDTNGLIEREINVIGIVPEKVDRLITNWINKSTEENFDEIKKIVPNVYQVNDYKYLFMLLEKRLGKKIEANNLNPNDVGYIIGFINDKIGYDLNDVQKEEYDEAGVISKTSYHGYFRMQDFLVKLSTIAPPDVRNRLQVYQRWEIDNYSLLDYLNEKFKTLYGRTFDDIKINKDILIDIGTNHPEIITIMYNMQYEDILRTFIMSWINNCESEDLYLIQELIPDVFERNDGFYYIAAQNLGKLPQEEYAGIQR